MGGLHAISVDEKGAVTASANWLSSVDDGKYAECWDQAAELLKNAVSKDQLQNSLKAARSPLGKVVTRKLKSKQYTKSLPGAPDGDYVIIFNMKQFLRRKSLPSRR